MSEERFKNMTPLQWLFHYYEILKFRKLERDRQDSMLGLILDRLEILWLTTDREMGKELLELKKQSTMKKGARDHISPDNFHEEWAKIMQTMPKEIKKSVVQAPRTTNLPKFSKEQLRRKIAGIQIEAPSNSEKDE